MKPHETGRRGRPPQGGSGPAANPPEEGQASQPEIQRVIQQGGKPLVTAAERLGGRLVQGGLTTSQIRNVYGLVKRMEMRGFDAGEFVLLKPKLAYAAARANKPGARLLRDVLSWAIDEVDEDEQKFARFVDFFEAILAYHKAEGGK
jgi:CRISPR-associated protein Csm2